LVALVHDTAFTPPLVALAGRGAVTTDHDAAAPADVPHALKGATSASAAIAATAV
jgi:gamma-glutamyltranspeptidase